MSKTKIKTTHTICLSCLALRSVSCVFQRSPNSCAFGCGSPDVQNHLFSRVCWTELIWAAEQLLKWFFISSITTRYVIIEESVRASSKDMEKLLRWRQNWVKVNLSRDDLISSHTNYHTRNIASALSTIKRQTRSNQTNYLFLTRPHASQSEATACRRCSEKLCWDVKQSHSVIQDVSMQSDESVLFIVATFLGVII